MTRLIVRFPDSLRQERAYAAHVVLQVQLGIAHDTVFEARTDVSIQASNDPTRSLRLPDSVFAAGEAGWPATAARPAAVDASGIRCRPPASRSVEGSAGGDVVDGTFELDVDVFGTAFWYLTRLEEVLADVRDEHGRFPVEASLDDNQRPTVDLMVDAFGDCLKALWPALELRRQAFSVAPTHDVDRPFKHLFQSPRKLLRGMARDALNRTPAFQIAKAPWLRYRVRAGNLPLDPFNTFEWLMDRSDELGVKSTFYFICTDEPGGIDGDYRVDDPRIRGLIRRIHDRGHLIGLHGSYMSAYDPVRLRAEVERLRSACASEGIELDRIRARQHVLRFEPRRTVGVWADAGIDEDSTLGHAGRPGFRCGTCRAYPLFDVAGRRMTSVIERPLIVMDVSLTERRYEALTPAQSNARIDDLLQQCRQVQGTFVLLWHNCRLDNAVARAMYARALAPSASLQAPL